LLYVDDAESFPSVEYTVIFLCFAARSETTAYVLCMEDLRERLGEKARVSDWSHRDSDAALRSTSMLATSTLQESKLTHFTKGM
jgi:hypothetical protein